MNYAGPAWPVIIIVAVIVGCAIAGIIVSSRGLHAAHMAGQRRPGARTLQIVAIIIGVLGVLWLVVSLVSNLALSAR